MMNYVPLSTRILTAEGARYSIINIVPAVLVLIGFSQHFNRAATLTWGSMICTGSAAILIRLRRMILLRRPFVPVRQTVRAD